jgi:hypothetical protein
MKTICCCWISSALVEHHLFYVYHWIYNRFIFVSLHTKFNSVLIQYVFIHFSNFSFAWFQWLCFVCCNNKIVSFFMVVTLASHLYLFCKNYKPCKRKVSIRRNCTRTYEVSAHPISCSQIVFFLSVFISVISHHRNVAWLKIRRLRFKKFNLEIPSWELILMQIFNGTCGKKVNCNFYTFSFCWD